MPLLDCHLALDSMKTRLAVAADLADVMACEDLAFNSTPSTPLGNSTLGNNVSPRAELALQIDRGEIHVITAGSLFLGYISFSQKHDHLFVAAIAVLPKYHRTGSGSRLLSLAESTASRLGLGKVHLFTDGHSAGNLKFYRRLGYHETGRCQEGEFFRVYLCKAVGGTTQGNAPPTRHRSTLSAA